MVKALSSGDKLLNEVSMILQSTGVVRGEYGFVDVYKEKLEAIKPWLELESDEKIGIFAQSHVLRLEQLIEEEKKRADEGVILQKHRYDDEDS